jgi:hypothetical protein
VPFILAVTDDIDHPSVTWFKASILNFWSKMLLRKKQVGNNCPEIAHLNIKLSKTRNK